MVEVVSQPLDFRLCSLIVSLSGGTSWLRPHCVEMFGNPPRVWATPGDFEMAFVR